MTVLLMIHILGAVTGLLSGFTALFLPKGSGWHGAAGTVFFVAMLAMSMSSAYIAAFLHPISINVVAATLTMYLVTTSWVAAKRREGGTNWFDVAALLWILAVFAGAFKVGFAGPRHGIPAPAYFIFGTVALLLALTDVRFLRRGGATGTRRIARHLWRMSLALLLATVSLYPGQAKLFPPWIRQTSLPFIPHVLLIGTLVFYAVRYRTRKRAAIAAMHGEPVAVAG